MKNKFLLVASMVIILISCKKKDKDEEFINPPQTQNDIAAIDNAVQNLMSNFNIPGVSIAVIKQGSLVYLKAYGKMSATDATPITTESKFRIASVSKPITGVGIMKLLEANKLTMASKIFGPGSILGADFPNAPAATHDITVRHLLDHTTGVWGNDGTDPMFQQPTYNHTQLINWTLANYPANTGRGTYRYSNFGYCLLGRVIEKLSGKTYEQFIKDAVLAPCGITAMTIGGNTLADRKPGEVLYTSNTQWSPYAYNIERMDSHGGWIASAKDLAKFIIRVDGFNNKEDILYPPTIQVMTTPGVPGNGYAGGWSINQAGNWWHTGSLPGTSTELIRAANGFSWVVLTNGSSSSSNFWPALDNLLWPVINNASTPWQNIDQF